MGKSHLVFGAWAAEVEDGGAAVPEKEAIISAKPGGRLLAPSGEVPPIICWRRAAMGSSCWGESSCVPRGKGGGVLVCKRLGVVLADIGKSSWGSVWGSWGGVRSLEEATACCC